MGIFNDNSQNNNTGGSGQPGPPGQKGDPGIGFKLTADGNFDLDNKQMKNLSGGIDKSDAVNYGQLLEHTENHHNNYHLQPSFTFYRNFGSQKKVPQSNTIKIDSNHNHHGLNWIAKEGSDSGFGGQAWVSLKMTNNLPVGIYTVVFELFSGISGISGSVTQLNNETLLQQVHGDANYTIITFSHDYQTTHSKAVIQFNSNGQAGEITFQIRYYGSSYNNSTLNFLFFSRVIAGRQSTAFNHALFDVDDVQLTNQILYFDDVNLNGNKIENVAIPTNDQDVANKRYVDDEIAKLPHSDDGTLKLDGSRAMTGTLNLGGQRVINIKEFVEDDSSQAASDAQKYDVVNWGKIHEIRGDLKREINAVEYEALNRINPNPMEDDIDMGNNFITNVKEPGPSNSNYATTVNFVNKTIDDRLKHSVQSADTSNAFQYVMDDPAGQFYDEDDIKGIKKTDKDFHKSNKETYEMQLLLDSRGYYSSRLGVNMYILPNGEYSLVYELYYPNTIDSSTVQISAVSSVETVSKVTTNVFNNHTRSIIHLHKYNNVAPNRLMIDMVLKNKAGISYANELTIFVIVYGLSGHFNNVETSVWDRLFEVTNDSIKFETNIDLNNNEIKNIADGVENNDAVNIKQLNEMENLVSNDVDREINKLSNNVYQEINKLKPSINDNDDFINLLVSYILSNESKLKFIKKMYFPDNLQASVDGREVFSTIGGNNGYSTFYFIIKHNGTTNRHLLIEFYWVGPTNPVFLFIYKNRLELRGSGLSTRIINFSNNIIGKQLYFWLYFDVGEINIIFSGQKDFITIPNREFQANMWRMNRVTIRINPFDLKRALLTKNIYKENSHAFRNVKDFERGQGTII